MAKMKQVFRGLSMVFAFGLAASITCGVVMEKYPAPLDAYFDTLSSRLEAEEGADWTYESNFKTAKEAFDGFKEFAIRESQETFALLKNDNNALPISKTAKVTLMGLRSYAPVYGNSGGSIADKKTVENGNRIYEAFAARGFQLNPSMLGTYEEYFSDKTWGGRGFGATPPEYGDFAGTETVYELSPSELAEVNAEYDKDFAEYGDAAILVFGRPGGESKNYRPGESGISDDTVTNTGNVLGLSTEELAIVKEAKDNFEKVIVLINSTNQLDIADIAAAKTTDNYGVDAILWIGYPGAYGFYGVADVLNGTVSPSAHLGDTYAKNNALAPAMMNFGDMTPWQNAKGVGDNVNSYLINAEGIYTGYRYYETRYADIVEGVAGASTAKAGTYAAADGKPATVDGTWSYANEVVYPFGRGLSYTTFTQTIDNVTITDNKKTADVTVTVTNTGTVAGKSVIELYAQAPYISGGIEKSAIQLVDYEKTDTLAPISGHQTITLHVDLSNLASYDYKTAKTFVVDAGDYYFAIGDDAHDALNNILAAKGKTTADGMTANGDATKTYKWTWDYDKEAFATSATGVAITNHLSEGIYATDFNAFVPGTVTYLSRSNWNGTFPKTYSGLSATASENLRKALSNDFIDLKEDVKDGDFTWGAKNNITLQDMALADWDDPRWAQIVDEVTVQEFITFASNAFHNIQEIPSVGYTGNNADDGPGGSDTHYFEEGSYQGKAYEDAEDYEGYGTRVAPTPTNLAYSWNKELAYENGEIILGESTLVLGLPIMIGPGGNIHRHAYNGRGGEYYSEDPILSGFTGSAVVQGAQSKGCLVNIKHAAFNDQEINRSGVAAFPNEQAARELELRNLQQMFTAKGKPANWVGNDDYDDTYLEGALGVMTSYNRIGATASSANKGVMVDIMRNEWGFKGYSVTDFTGVSMKAAPKESVLFGTTAFCGFGGSVPYFKEETLSKDSDMCNAIKTNTKYILYSLAHSAVINGAAHRVQLMSTWRQLYISLIVVSSVLTVASLGAYTFFALKKKKEDN